LVCELLSLISRSGEVLTIDQEAAIIIAAAIIAITALLDTVGVAAAVIVL
jgi:hypothetical protein